MTNPINIANSPPDRISTRPTREGAAPAAGPASPEKPPSSGDTVSLTSTELLRAASGDIDSKKVAQIKADVEAGRYNLDPEAIAEKLLAFEAELSRSRE